MGQSVKLTAGKLFDGYRFQEKKAMIISSNGIIKEILPIEEAGDDIRTFPGFLCPGFVNCHCHLELSHMKGMIPIHSGLAEFVFQVVTNRHFSENEILKAIQNGEKEMYDNGIVAVGDIVNNNLTILQKIKKALLYYNFIEASGWAPALSDSRFLRAFEIYEEFRELCGGSSRNSIVPHAPYSVSQNLWQSVKAYFKNKVITMHNQETQDEDLFFLEGGGELAKMYKMLEIDNSHYKPPGCSSLRSVFHHLTSAASIILVHNTFTRQEDLSYIKSIITPDGPLVSFCLCPNANLYIENTLPPVNLLRQNNLSIVLGTDSLASNQSLDILYEISVLQQYLPSVSLEEMLQWATLNGAKALKMDQLLGSFEKDKKPGVLHINGSEIERLY